MRVRLRPPDPEHFLGEPAPINYETTKEFLDSVWGNITKHGIKVMADGRQWVVHCLTGQPIERHNAKPFRDAKNNIFWIGKNEELSPLDKPVQQHWKNPG